MDNSIEEKKLEDCAVCACFNLRKAARVITQLYDRRLAPSGIRSTQFSIMAVLAVHSPETLTRVAETLAMDRTTLTRNMRPMEKQGYLKVNRGQDQRTKRLTLTKKGRKAFAKTFPRWECIQKQVIKKYGLQKFNSFIKDLREISTLFIDKQ
ncbi:MAG: winged helix-turn-helix transcriptional regulator [Nitrospiraceae bacterium]|jgi:DNA-binding MarR family transcriptional regulator|nr:MAG: winged helix-turn-helix transcriptional regulator [Nitrospiraceae bacterium]